MISLGEFLRDARIRADLKQVEVEKKIGINHKTLSNWENNVSKPSADDLIALSKLYVTTVDSLVGTENMPSRHAKLFELNEKKRVPVIGSVRCGAGGPAYEYIDEYIAVDDSYRADEMRGFRAEGDSMEPVILDGDICLVHLQDEVPDGAIAVVVIDGEEGTIKCVHIDRERGVITLQPKNPRHETRYFSARMGRKFTSWGRSLR